MEILIPTKEDNILFKKKAKNYQPFLKNSDEESRMIIY